MSCDGGSGKQCQAKPLWQIKGTEEDDVPGVWSEACGNHLSRIVSEMFEDSDLSVEVRPCTTA